AWIRVLTSLGNRGALPALTMALTSTDASVAAEAARQLGRWPDLAPLEPLLKLMEASKDPAQRARALTSAIQLLTVAAEKNQRPADALAALFARAAKFASTAPDRRRLISGLARVPHDGSLRLLQGFYEDSALRTEAAVAIVQIAPALAKQSPSPALRKALLGIAAGESSEEIRAQATRAARLLPQVTDLFNGTSLDGWAGNPDVWRVRDGTIVGGSMNGNPQNEFLATTRDYGDFVLRLEYKLVGTEGFVNGGVQFRSVRIQQPANEMAGFQADIGAGHTGCLYDESRRNGFLMRGTDEQIKRLEKPGDWNQYEVWCAGSHIQVVLNGEKMVDYIEPDPGIPRTGLIALQIHGNCKAEISFRNIKLEELSYGAAIQHFGIGKSKWKVVSVSSENTQVEDERAALAIDDNPATFWHTQWSGGKPGHPHHLAVDLGESAEVSGFTYLPRQDGRQTAGVIGAYEFYVSRDGKEWGQPVSRGQFESIDRNPAGQVVMLPKVAIGRYFKIVSLSAPGSQPYAGAAEIGILGKPAR
ncbi:MAG TPA: family 16 glycoside hydrolase, partial [Tepidisphaeraceae bacterium]|nr:family 16 glycoside hydrolase [Tepidisphaeraceae bacterium]